MTIETADISTPLHAFYIQSMLANTASAIQSLHTASDIIKKYETGELSLDEQEKSIVLLNSLQNIVSQSGAISRYFWPSRDTPQKATDTQKKLHKNRGEYLKEIFCINNGNPLEDRKLRNDLEHFDERLDLYLSHGMFGYIFPSLIMAKPDETGTPHHIFRAFYLIDGIFQILGERYQMQPIVDEMTRIHRKLVEFDENGCVFKRPNVKQEQ